MNGKFEDGLEKYNYIEYTTTARVWDAAHGCFADLEAGKTYAATGDAEFTLGSIKYTDTKESEKDELTLTLDQKLHGGWKLADHNSDHNFVWEYREGDKAPSIGGYVELERQCTVLGCTEKAHKHLLHKTESLDDLTYRGSKFETADIEALLEAMFGIDISATCDFGSYTLLGKGDYTIAITLSDALWAMGEDGHTYQAKAEGVKVKILPFTLAENAENLSITGPTNVTYNGHPQSPEVSLSFHGAKLNFTQDYNIDYTQNTDAGQATVTITGIGNFTGEIVLHFEIERAKIEGYKLNIENTYTYNGTQQTPKFNISGSLSSLIKPSDYTIALENATNASVDGRKAKITLTFADGNFEGTLSAEFEIGKKAVEITLLPQTATYTGSALTPSSDAAYWSFSDDAICSQNGVKDDLRIQITLARGTALNAGDYDLTFSFENSNYVVNRKADDGAKFKITAKKIAEIEGATLTVDGTYTYNGTQQTPSYQIDLGTFTATAEDYTVALNNATNATTADKKASVTLTFKRNFEGTLTATFDIAKAPIRIKAGDLNSAQDDTLLDVQANGTYTLINNTKFFDPADEKAFKEALIYTCEGLVNTEVKDYTIKVTVKEGFALDNYTFETEQFETGTYSVTDSVFKGVSFNNSDDIIYDGKLHDLRITLAQDYQLPDGADVTYKYQGGDFKGVKDVGKYEITVEIVVAGHHTFTANATLSIIAKNIGEATVTVNSKHTYTGHAITPTELTVSLGDDWTEDITFKIDSYGNNMNATSEMSKATVTVSGTGNYTGTATGNFDIARKSIAGGTLTVGGTYTYDGTAQTPQGNALAVELQDFEDVTFQVKAEGGYDNNINATTAESRAKVTVEGTDNFEGELSAFFDIAQAKIDKVEVKDADAYVYNGSDIVPTLVVTSGTITLTDNDYTIQYTTTDNDHKNAGTVTFKVTGKGNFKDEVLSSFEINAKDVTVTIEKQTTTYNGDLQSAENKGFTLKTGSTLAGEEKIDVLDITLTASGTNAGKYDIVPAWKNNNYNVTFEYNDKPVSETENKAKEAFVIEKATITVTVLAASSTYGEAREALKVKADGIVDNDSDIVIEDYITLSCAVTATSEAKDYDIECKTNDKELENYNISIVNEVKYTVNKRPVTIKILDQNATFNIEGKYDLDGAKWELAEDAKLANDDTKDTLAITLKLETVTKAGAYKITGTCANNNYAVIFEGSWANEDEQKGKAGTYTVDKLDISDLNNITLSIGNGSEQDKNGVLIAKYEGEALTLFAMALDPQNNPLTLVCYIDGQVVASIEKEGTFEIRVEIADDNYTGSKTFKAVITDEKGYTENIRTVLTELEELLKGKTADDITLDDFVLVCDIAEKIAELTAEERELAEGELADYMDCIEAYNDLTKVDEDVIATAKKVADAPIEWLYETLATVSAIAALAYIAKKGRRLI